LAYQLRRKLGRSAVGVGMAALLAAIDGAECTLAKPLPQLVPLHGHGGPDGDGRVCANEGESNKKLGKK